MDGDPQDPRSTRERILDAALAAFADRGVEATSLDSLAAEVGVRKQTILYWFASKDQLLLGVIDHAVGRLGAYLSTAATGTSAPNRRRIDAQGRDLPDSDSADSLDRAEPDSPLSGSETSAPNRRRIDAQARENGPRDRRRARTAVTRLPAVVDATFRLGTSNPELIAVVREVARLGPPISNQLAAAVDPLVGAATAALAGPAADPVESDRIRRVLLAAGARVIGLATEAEVRADLGLPADVAWLRSRRRELLDSLAADLG